MKEYSDLELNKMMAELDGVKTHIDKSTLTGCNLLNSESYEAYNPVSNWSLLGPLMVKYKVEVRYAIKLVAIDNLTDKYEQVSYESESEIPRAIIMCILKSKNII